MKQLHLEQDPGHNTRYQANILQNQRFFTINQWRAILLFIHFNNFSSDILIFYLSFLIYTYMHIYIIFNICIIYLIYYKMLHFTSSLYWTTPYVWVPSYASTFGKFSGEVLFLNGKAMFVFETKLVCYLK